MSFFEIQEAEISCRRACSGRWVGQISNELAQYYQVEGLEEVRVIRDRQTSGSLLPRPERKRLTDTVVEVSRGLGFLRFQDLDHSRDFLERNFPAICLYGPEGQHGDDRGTKVRIAYSRERENRNRVREEGEWACTIVSTRLRRDAHGD